MAEKKRIFKNVDQKKIIRHYTKGQKLIVSKKKEVNLETKQTADYLEGKKEIIIVCTILILIFVFAVIFILSENRKISAAQKPNTKKISKTSPVNTIVTPSVSPSGQPTSISDLPQSISVPKLSGSLMSSYVSDNPLNLPLPYYFRRRDLLYINFDFDPVGKNWTLKQNGGELVPGPVGNALFLLPGDSLVATGSSQFATMGTLNFWIKLGPEGFDKEIPLIDWNFGGKNISPYLFEISYLNSKMIFSIYDGNGQRNEIDVLLSDWTVWHHVQYTWDFSKNPSNLEVFIDQKKLAQGSFPFIPLTYNNPVFQIGGGVGGRETIPFAIDQIVLTNWVKTDAEMASEN